MIEWNKVDTVLLDMDGTLLDLHFDNHFWLEHLPKRYAQKHGMSMENAKHELYASFEQLRGSLDWYCVDYWSQTLELDIAALKEEVSHLISVRPHAEQFLRSLSQSPKKVLLVTNAHSKSLNLKMAITAIDHYFDEIVCSHDYALPKEHPDFWAKLQADYHFEPGRTLFIDDSVAVLDAAAAFGIRYLLTLLQPDSRQPLRETSHYPGIHHFDEIMPGETL